MKIKVSEAVGPTLDWLVAKCEGKNGVLHGSGIARCIVIAAASGVYKGTFKPTENWSQGGPIIESEGINLSAHYKIHTGEWQAWCERGPSAYGSTSLIAAMRCFVASRLGDEVEVPDDLA